MLRSRSIIALAFLAASLGACEGSSGTGGLSIPAAPQYNAPGGPGGAAASTSRQQVLEGAVTLAPDRSEIPLPTLGGFSTVLELSSPAPTVVSSAVATVFPKSKASASPSPAPLAVASGVPSARPSLSASSTPAAAAASASPAPETKIVTKTTIYPDDAPAAPTPRSSGDVQTFVKRDALVRGYVEPSSDVVLYGLAAIRFTIPQAEQTSGRGFTIAVFEAAKKHHERLVAFDSSPMLANGVVASSLASDPIALKKTTPYFIVLYGDPGAPTPAPATTSYPTPGNNPFPTQTPGTPGQSQPGYPQQPGAPQQVPTPTPTPFP